MSLFSCFKKSRSSVSSTGVSEGIFRKRGPGFTTQPGAHSAQHAWAALYQKTKDLRLVQVALGHRNITNTMIYADYVYSQQELRRLIL